MSDRFTWQEGDVEMVEPDAEGVSDSVTSHAYVNDLKVDTFNVLIVGYDADGNENLRGDGTITNEELDAITVGDLKIGWYELLDENTAEYVGKELPKQDE